MLPIPTPGKGFSQAASLVFAAKFFYLGPLTWQCKTLKYTLGVLGLVFPKYISNASGTVFDKLQAEEDAKK